MRLWAENLACSRGGRDVFADLAFSVSQGQALAVRGRNGAGGPSLLRVLAGLLRPARGRVGFDGGEREAALSEQVHYLGHQDALKPSLTVAENLGFWTAYLGGRREAVTPALERLDLRRLADLPAAYLSAGQRRRLSLARLVTVSRSVWLLDEPATALDAIAQDRLVGLMQDYLRDGGIVVAATHAPLGLEPVRELTIGAGA